MCSDKSLNQFNATGMQFHWQDLEHLSCPSHSMLTISLLQHASVNQMLIFFAFELAFIAFHWELTFSFLLLLLCSLFPEDVAYIGLRDVDPGER